MKGAAARENPIPKSREEGFALIFHKKAARKSLVGDRKRGERVLPVLWLRGREVRVRASLAGPDMRVLSLAWGLGEREKRERLVKE